MSAWGRYRLEKKWINCYFCKLPALKAKVKIDRKVIHLFCWNCGYYVLSPRIVRYHLNKETKELEYIEEKSGIRKNLPDELKFRLSEYVRERSAFPVFYLGYYSNPYYSTPQDFDHYASNPQYRTPQVVIDKKVFFEVTGKRVIREKIMDWFVS